MAALWTENKRLKEELKTAKRLVSDISEKPLPRFLQAQLEIARLKAVIFEYEITFSALANAHGNRRN